MFLMFAWLKKYFIPHEENEFRPHFFRRDTVVFLSIILASLFVLFIFGSRYLIKSNYFAAILPRVLVSYANETRQQVLDDGQLATNLALEKAAKMKAEDMAGKEYFAHTSPDGKTPWYWFEQAGYNFKYAGENLAVNFIDSVDVQNAWMASPSHKGNILDPKFKEIGIATATGTYQGKEAIFVVELFGTPAVSEPPKDIMNIVALQQGSKAGNVEVSPTAGASAAVAGGLITIAIPDAEEGQISGAYQEKTPSILDNLIASPRAGLVGVYTIFIVFVLALILVAVLWELRRHHISIWINGSLLLAVAFVLITATIYLRFGALRIL